MTGFLDAAGGYYEGDRQGEDREVPQRPSWIFRFDAEAGAWQPDPDHVKALLRELRVEKLSEADAGVNKAEDAGKDPKPWRAYRQALRDMTKDLSCVSLADPHAPAVTWPALPA